MHMKENTKSELKLSFGAESEIRGNQRRCQLADGHAEIVEAHLASGRFGVFVECNPVSARLGYAECDFHFLAVLRIGGGLECLE